MSLDTVNEASTMNVLTKFYGLSNVPTVPSSVRYRLKDITNDRVVTDWTDLVPALEVEIEISAEENQIYLDGRRPFQRFETRALVVQANYGTPTQYVAELQYMIKNLRGFDS